EYRLMTQFTSFVAVEETVVTDGGQPRRIDIPVEMPEGVSHQGVFGNKVEAYDVSVNRQLKEKGRQQIQLNGGSSGFAGSFYSINGRADEARRATTASSARLGAADAPAAPVPISTPKLMVNEPASISISEGRLQGSVMKKVQPTYPPIAKAARASGP